MSTTGSCACGAIKYEYTGEPAVTGESHQRAAALRMYDCCSSHHYVQEQILTLVEALCHCIDCQKWTGGPYTSNVVVPRTNFKVTSGTPKTWDAKGNSGKINKHFFCGTCGSGLYTELEVMPEMTCVKAGGLDGGAASLGGKVGVEFYTKDRVSYLQGIDGAKQEPVFG